MALNRDAKFVGMDFIWDVNLQPGVVMRDLNGIWHVGSGTDLRVAMFDHSLTPKDKRFLKALRIYVESGD